MREGIISKIKGLVLEYNLLKRTMFRATWVTPRKFLDAARERFAGLLTVLLRFVIPLNAGLSENEREMREIEISVSRSYPVEQLKDEWKKKSPKGKFGVDGVIKQAPGDLDEAIAKCGGKVAVFNEYMKQYKLNLQNELAEEIAKKVLDPSKVAKRSEAVQVDLS